MTLLIITKALNSAIPTWLKSKRTYSRYLCMGIACVSACLLASTAQAGSREQALQIHNRVAGVPPSETVLLQMAAFLDAGQKDQAVQLAMNNEAFYSVVLKNMATPWTNREQTVFAPLNDYTATVIGLVRDNADFRKLLFDDVTYIANPTLGLPAYSNSNNNHYQAIEDQGVDLDLVLKATTGKVQLQFLARYFLYVFVSCVGQVNTPKETNEIGPKHT